MLHFSKSVLIIHSLNLYVSKKTRLLVCIVTCTTCIVLSQISSFGLKKGLKGFTITFIKPAETSFLIIALTLQCYFNLVIKLICL